ncbi:dTDP-4-amino-4,6-dideoxygalactose transaminase [Polaribacter sp.]|uniref:dTDP-4-amino-4,6-dideoxygalactose transaminase n=1 Tax=Polaribacter sp. TaxID=1920175 RepID=UPI00404774BD
MSYKIPFNRPPYAGNEEKFVIESMRSSKMSGDGAFTLLSQNWFKDNFHLHSALLTPSCTHALDLSAILIDIIPGDEVIMSSYTFVSTANAFVLRGAKIVFVDIDPNTMNIDVHLIENAITNRTKAIVPVHYAGVSCEMDVIHELARKYNLVVIEDAAQGIMSKFRNKYLGSIGHIGAYSFHETKNITSGGEGGALIINDDGFLKRAEILREKGTNRKAFLNGSVDKYTWVDIGSSMLPSEIQAAYLWGQLQNIEKITSNRMYSWNKYFEGLKDLEGLGKISLPYIPDYAIHNAHLFYIKVAVKEDRDKLISYLNQNGIQAVFHYIPLHSAPAGLKFGRFNCEDIFTTSESEKLVRLPLYFNISSSDIDYVISNIYNYFKLIF